MKKVFLAILLIALSSIIVFSKTLSYQDNISRLSNKELKTFSMPKNSNKNIKSLSNVFFTIHPYIPSAYLGNV